MFFSQFFRVLPYGALARHFDPEALLELFPLGTYYPRPKSSKSRLTPVPFYEGLFSRFFIPPGRRFFRRELVTRKNGVKRVSPFLS